MIIFNTTYHVAPQQADRFLTWIRTEYVPAALRSGDLSHARLALVLADHAESDGDSYSLQFNVSDEETLSRWCREQGSLLSEIQRSLFGNEVLGFTTLLDEIDLLD